MHRFYAFLSLVLAVVCVSSCHRQRGDLGLGDSSPGNTSDGRNAPASGSSRPDAVVSQRTGASIDIRTVCDDDMFPRGWHDRVTARPLPPAYTDEALAAVESALDKYPTGFVCRYVRRVYVLGGLRIDGTPVQGTNSRDAVFVCYQRTMVLLQLGGGETPGGAAELERALHHELSSILLREEAALFPRAQWSSTLPPGFEYGDGGLAAVRAGAPLVVGRPKDLEDGFLSAYGRSSLENDFNMAFAEFMSDPRRIETLGKEHSRIRVKADLIREFLTALDGRFFDQWRVSETR